MRQTLMKMRRWLSLSAFAALAAACVSSPKPVPQDAAPSASSGPTGPSFVLVKEAGTSKDAAAAGDAALGPEAIAKGEKLYEKYCSFCHAPDGKGYKADEAPALASDDLLALASDAYLRDAITNGRPGTTMSAWSVARGGPLSFDDANAVVAFLRTWQKGPAESTEGRKIAATAKADRGAPIYAAQCASCHGAKGSGGKHNALGNPELLASATDGFLATTIERGRKGTPMPSFEKKLTTEQVDDIVSLLRTWQKAPDATPPLPPKAGALTNVVVNPKGGDAPFDPKASFVPVDEVKKALDAKAAMVIIDARPPADYARMHIAGAISVPFYEVEGYAKQIPKDKYVLTYCACPHAESGKVQMALRALGYPRVAVIDEGLFVWRDRGYPVRGGAKP